MFVEGMNTNHCSKIFNQMEKTEMKRKKLKGLGEAQATFSFPSMKHICVFLWLFFKSE
jgi:hypothetical protein